MTMPVMDPALTHAYDTCRRMHRRHDPTYYWATRRLPADVRPATHALYGYVRTADQLVDGPRRAPTPEARRAALDAWEGELARGLEQGGSENPVVGALVDAARRHDLPLSELRPYMRSMRVDCAPVRIGTWEELVAYMEGSAGSVGRIMAPLLGVPEDHHADYGRLGLAFQHANFVRDVAEDFGLDRIYLPEEDRERFGVAEADFACRTASPELRALVEHEVARARRLFAAAAPAVAAAPAAVRPGIRLACAVYESVLDRVEAAGYDVLGRRMGVRIWRLPPLAFGALRPS
jgi:15-cis-phytoene synthase